MPRPLVFLISARNSMKRSLPAKLCYVLLVACIPASMVCVFYMPGWMHAWLSDKHPDFYLDIFEKFYPSMPAWLQYFAVQTLAALIALCGAVYVFGREDWLRRPRLSRRHVFPALVAAYAIWAGLTYFWSAWPYGTRAYFIRELPFYFLCIVAMLVCREERRWRTVALAFLIGAFVEALLQGVVLHERALAIAKDAAEANVAMSTLTILRKSFGPPTGKPVFYSNPNFSCALVLTGAFIAVAFGLQIVLGLIRPGQGARRRAFASGLALAGLAVAIALFGAILVAANSLAGYLAGIVAAFAYVLCILPFKRRWPVIAALGVIAMIAMLAFLGSQKVQTKVLRGVLSPERTTSLRIVDWLAAKELYVRRPIHGWGMGTFPATYAQVHPPLARRLRFTAELRTTHPHNEFVRVAADQGLIGLLLYAAILVYAFAVSYIHLRDKPTKTRILGFALWAGALTFTVQSAFGKAPMGWSFSTNYWILLGVLASTTHWTGEAAQAQEDDRPLRIGAVGWVALGVAAFLIGWGWWTWAVGSYASKVHMNRARTARLTMSKPGQQWQFEKFKAQLAEARPRCLWPDDILHDEYVVGWFLTDHRRWVAAAEQLERVQQIAPDFLETRLFLARCYLNMGKRREALENLAGYLRVDPYNPKAYRLLSFIDPAAAIAALEQEVFSRLVQPDDWIVEDPPTSGQVSQLLDFYIRGGQFQKARDTATRVEKFMATAQLSRSSRIGVSQLLQELRQKYERGDEKQLLRHLDATFPDLGRRGTSLGRQSP